MPPFITLEEHYISPAVRASTAHDEFAAFPARIVQKLESLSSERITDMDAGNVALQILSHAPGTHPAPLCTSTNDALAAAISAHPTRLAGFALLPMSSPTEAAAELSRCVTQHGFLGALVDNHINGRFYDGDEFRPVFAKAQELDVPIYIHPSWASESMLEHYKGNYEDGVAVAMSAFGWGWHSETAVHVMKLYASGLFDEFPRLKIVIGHMGEMLPFQLERVINVAGRWGRRRGFQEVWDSNFWITTSGMFSLAPLACLLRTTRIERVLYSVDYPFSDNEKGKDFFERIKESGLISGEDLEKFAHGNAEALLGVRAVGK
jgi:predicted TIM-barrel fold metal-dependent hydrolase